MLKTVSRFLQRETTDKGEITNYKLSLPSLLKFLLSFSLLAWDMGGTFDRTLEREAPPRVLYCPIRKENCIGSRCFKWYTCLHERYEDFMFMRNDADEIPKCPPELFLKIMSGRIQEREVDS